MISFYRIEFHCSSLNGGIVLWEPKHQNAPEDYSIWSKMHAHKKKNIYISYPCELNTGSTRTEWISSSNARTHSFCYLGLELKAITPGIWGPYGQMDGWCERTNEIFFNWGENKNQFYHSRPNRRPTIPNSNRFPLQTLAFVLGFSAWLDKNLYTISISK